MKLKLDIALVWIFGIAVFGIVTILIVKSLDIAISDVGGIVSGILKPFENAIVAVWGVIGKIFSAIGSFFSKPAATSGD